MILWAGRLFRGGGGGRRGVTTQRYLNFVDTIDAFVMGLNWYRKDEEMVSRSVRCCQEWANGPSAGSVLNICCAGSHLPKAEVLSPQKWSRDVCGKANRAAKFIY